MKIALSAVLAFMLIGCSGDSKEESKAAQTQEATTPKETAKSEPSVVEKSVQSVKQEATKQAQAAQKVVEESAKEVVEESKEVVQKAEEVAKESVEEATKKVQEVVETTTVSASDGQAIYRTCSACHGVNGDKPALGKSQVIKGWDASKVESALKGYKDGSYGGAMKGLMKSQVAKLSDADIKAVAEHISKL